MLHSALDEAFKIRKCMNLIDLSAQLRADVIEMSHRAKAAHLASALSCVDILGVLYGKVLKLEATQPTAPQSWMWA